jgi:hypothetical protein
MAGGLINLILVDLSTMSLASLYMHQNPSNLADEHFGIALGAELVRRKVLTITPDGSVWDFAKLKKEDGFYFYLETLEDGGARQFLYDANRFLARKGRRVL